VHFSFPVRPTHTCWLARLAAWLVLGVPPGSVGLGAELRGKGVREAAAFQSNFMPHIELNYWSFVSHLIYNLSSLSFFPLSHFISICHFTS